MSLYNKESRLSDAILAHPQLIPVINRLGVELGMGDRSIGAICLEKGIDADFFLSVVNTFLDSDYFPVNARGTFTLAKTIDYLRMTALFYCRVQLPNIRRHFTSLTERSRGENNLGFLRSFFDETAERIEALAASDEEGLYPSLLRGADGSAVRESVESHDEIEARLLDLLHLFVAHLKGECDRNLCTAVVTAIFSLSKDYRQNNRIRRRILLPVAGIIADYDGPL